MTNPRSPAVGPTSRNSARMLAFIFLLSLFRPMCQTVCYQSRYGSRLRQRLNTSLGHTARPRSLYQLTCNTRRGPYANETSTRRAVPKIRQVGALRANTATSGDLIMLGRGRKRPWHSCQRISHGRIVLGDEYMDDALALLRYRYDTASITLYADVNPAGFLRCLQISTLVICVCRWKTSSVGSLTWQKVPHLLIFLSKY